MKSDFDRVELADVSRHFGRRRAVSHVSLTINRGDILGLLGPNGAGKSTLIGMLATLVEPSSGSIRYGDAKASTAGANIRGRIGMLAHELHLYPELTARQNLEFFARMYGLTAAGTADAALASADLSDRDNDQVLGFSRGMRQRLALERALLHQPTLVLLDEPFTGLDDRAVRLVADRFRRLAADGAIVVLATHDLDLADGLLDHALFLRDGRPAASMARPERLRSTYQHVMTRALEGPGA